MNRPSFAREGRNDLTDVSGRKKRIKGKKESDRERERERERREIKKEEIVCMYLCRTTEIVLCWSYGR